MSQHIKQVILSEKTIKIEFSDNRTLTASIDFFTFVSEKVATNPWSIIDLITKDEYLIWSNFTKINSENNKTIWFETKYGKDGCGITTAIYWYKNKDKLGENPPQGLRLCNGQKVSDNNIVLDV